MSEPSFGKLYHTQDGKTVFIDPKTSQATVFEGVKTMEQIMEPKEQVVTSDPSTKGIDAIKALMSMLPMLPMSPALPAPGGVKFDFILLTGNQPAEVMADEADILGPKDYYVLVPKENEGIITSMGATKIYAWVSEFKNGHKPEYKGNSKHRIMQEQFDWLMQHKTCPVVAWYSLECPAFVSVACQSHAKAIQPMLTPEKIKGASEAGLFVSSESIDAIPEAISAEEREV